MAKAYKTIFHAYARKKTISQTISQLITEKKVKRIFSKKYPLAKAQEAYKLSQRGYGRGHIVLEITENNI